MTEQVTPKRLLQYADLMIPENYLTLDKIQDLEVTILSARVGTGKFGPFAVLEIADTNGEIGTFLTSGFLVVDALTKAIDAKALPLLVKFTRTGRCWRIE